MTTLAFPSPCICGSDAYAAGPGPYRSADGRTFRVALCAACELGRTDPPPFTDDVTAPVHQELAYEDVIEREVLWRGFFAPLFSAARRHAPAGRFLDVGCGVGLCLQMAAEMGYDPWGVEINERTATFARDVLGRRVLHSDLAAATFPSGHFSVVLLSHVLEHLVNPRPVFDEVRRILAPGGVVVVEVPNMAGLQPRLLRGKWGGWSPEMHVWQFTPRTLRASMQRLGFVPREIRARDNMYLAQPRQPVKRLLRNTVFRAIELVASATSHGDKVLCVASC